MTVGLLQEVLLADDFTTLIDRFGKQNCMHFDATEENKLVYTELFKQYCDLVENHLIRRLSDEIPGFEFESFVEEMKVRKDEVDEGIMDLLMSTADFLAFKDMMLSHRCMLVATTPKLRSGKAAALGLKDSLKEVSEREMQLKFLEDNVDKITIQCAKVAMHEDEDMEGEQRMDINLDIRKAK